MVVEDRELEMGEFSSYDQIQIGRVAYVKILYDLSYGRRDFAVRAVAWEVGFFDIRSGMEHFIYAILS
jgi:hypothetical protein